MVSSAGAAVGASLAGARAASAAGRPARTARVVLVRDEKSLGDDLAVDTEVLRRMVEQAVVRLTGEQTPQRAWLSLFRPGDVIGLVPTPHLNPTHDEVVDVVRGSLAAAGIAPDAIRMANGGPAKAEACTALIAMPALKAHWLTGIGTVLKCYIMYSGKPRDYHVEDSANLGRIWNLPHVKGKTRLVLVDALRPLCDKGPQPDPRYLWPYRGIIAGIDPVAVEAVGLRIIEAKRTALNGGPWPLSPPPICVQAADEVYGLGTSRWDEITLERIGWDKDLLLA